MSSSSNATLQNTEAPNLLPLSTIIRNVLLIAFSQGLHVSCVSITLTSSKLIGQAYSENSLTHTMPLGFLLLGMVIFTFPASGMANRLGRTKAFQLGTLLVMGGAGFTALMMGMTLWWGILLGLFLVGCGLSFGGFYIFAANDGAPSKYTGTISGCILLGGIVAALIGPQAARFSAHQETSIPMLMVPLITLGFGAMMFVLLSFVKTQTAKQKTEKKFNMSELSVVFKSSTFWSAAMIGALGYGVMTLVMNATTPWMFSKGMMIDHSSMVISVHLLGMFVPAPISGWIADRFGASKAAILGFLLISISLLIIGSWQDLIHFHIALFLLGVGWSLTVVSGTKLIIQFGRNGLKSTAEAGNLMLISLANIAASMNAAVVFYGLGSAGLLSISVGIVVLGTLSALLSMRLFRS